MEKDPCLKPEIEICQSNRGAYNGDTVKDPGLRYRIKGSALFRSLG